MDHHLWMYNMHYETGAGLKHEFIDSVRNFIEHTMTLDIFKNNRLVRVMVHVYHNGFKPRYFVWIDHGESDGLDGSFVQGHIGRETCDFYSYYFGHDVSCRRNRPNRNDEGDIDPLFPPISIFN
ncbi:hypothetical protein H5410_032538 [Solanum commersonii]|uniref:Uncharacterized protein n=1 Tax=Solanum commersonii TaxID=4109 RepID=A0A9J5YN70_SOLCO|nr:hypothetical protein H5410_032538 [Solanum commersonii]